MIVIFWKDNVIVCSFLVSVTKVGSDTMGYSAPAVTHGNYEADGNFDTCM